MSLEDKEEGSWGQTLRKSPCGHRGQGRGAVATSQGPPRNTSAPRGQERQRRASPGPAERAWPAPISGSQLQTGGIHLAVLSRSLGTCCGSPGKLRATTLAIPSESHERHLVNKEMGPAEANEKSASYKYHRRWVLDDAHPNLLQFSQNRGSLYRVPGAGLWDTQMSKSPPWQRAGDTRRTDSA